MQYTGSQFNGSGYASQPSHGYPDQFHQNQPQRIQHQYSGQQQQYVSTPIPRLFPSTNLRLTKIRCPICCCTVPAHRPRARRRHNRIEDTSTGLYPVMRGRYQEEVLAHLFSLGSWDSPVVTPILSTRTPISNTPHCSYPHQRLTYLNLYSLSRPHDGVPCFSVPAPSENYVITYSRCGPLASHPGLQRKWLARPFLWQLLGLYGPRVGHVRARSLKPASTHI